MGSRLVVVGYHGTTDALAHSILTRGFQPSAGRGHWLGAPLAYFYDDIDLARGWAEHWAVPRFGGQAQVVQATIDLTNCLDLTKIRFRQALIESAAAQLDMFSPERARLLTQNHGVRELDSFVLSSAIYGTTGDTLRFRSVRAFCVARNGTQPARIYPPAGPLYAVHDKQSWFDMHDHVQIGVADPGAILKIRLVR